jgi:hypothetical protein
MRLFYVFLLLISYTAQAQNQIDTIGTCKKLINTGKTAEAYALLKVYTSRHPRDFSTVWYTARIAAWNWDTKNSKQYYEQAIALQPKDHYIKLEYGKMLVDVGQYDEALDYLNDYISFDHNSLEAQLYLITAYFYKGNTDLALETINSLPDNQKNDPAVKKLQHQVLLYRSTNISLNTIYSTDDQPLTIIMPSLEVSQKLDDIWDWYAKGGTNLFNNDTLHHSAYFAQIGNHFYFKKIKTQAEAAIGVSNLSTTNKFSGTGKLSVSKKLFNIFAINLQAERLPYLYSISSTETNVMQTNLIAALVVDDYKHFTGRIQYLNQLYNDNNSIQSYSAWLLKQVWKNKIFKFKLGYAFAYSNANKTAYTSTISIDSAEKAASTQAIPAIYNPYFTPATQKINGLLFWAEIKFDRKTSLTLSGNIPVYATLLNPKIYLDSTSSSNVKFATSFSPEQYTPMDLKADFSYKASEIFLLNIGYQYMRTSFYTAQYVNVSLHYKLLRHE